MGRGRGRGRRATDLTPLQWQFILNEWGCCAYCGVTDVKLEVEHLIPLGSGGQHEVGNTIPACRTCNAARKRMPLGEWLNALRRQHEHIPLLERPEGQVKLANLSIAAKDNHHE